MEHYETINPNKLVPHPKNSFFFDDITGQQWETFKSDIQEHGILEMIIANPANNMIIAGHQRHRAALELKLPEVPVLWRRCKSEDEHIEMMISSNLKTRFGFKYSHINAIKTGRCVAELWRINNVRSGGRPKKGDNRMPVEEFFNIYGVYLGCSKDTMVEAKNAATIIDPLQKEVMAQNLSTRAAGRSIIKLTPEQQQVFYNIVGSETLKKMNDQEIHDLVPLFKAYLEKAEKEDRLNEEVEALKQQLSEYHEGSANTLSEINQVLTERDLLKDKYLKLQLRTEREAKERKIREQAEKRKAKLAVQANTQLSIVRKNLGALVNMELESSEETKKAVKEVLELAEALKIKFPDFI